MNLTSSILNFDENEIDTICSGNECYLSSLNTKKKSEAEKILRFERNYKI